MKAYPLFFEPVLKEKIWGGSKLKQLYDKKSISDQTGESWEISAHPNGASTIINGELAGFTLAQALEKNKVVLLGKHMADTEKFPLLLKIIDADEQLSVQVHPEDVFAMLNENGEYGKNEAWYVLEAEEGASLVLGLKEGISKALFLKALEDGKLESVLNIVAVKASDVIDIPAGLVHAIGSGIVLAEIQQNSDTTYRVYDWNRKDNAGIGRELHIDKALQVIDFDNKIPTSLVHGYVEKFGDCSKTLYVDNDYFSLEELFVSSEYDVKNKADYFELYLCIEGQGSIHWVTGEHKIIKGCSFLIPAGLKDFKVKGPLKLLRMCHK